MKRVIIKDVTGYIVTDTKMDNPEKWIDLGISSLWWGKPERWTLHKDEFGAEPYDDADVLEEELRPDPLLIDNSKKWVKLKAEYTIEIEDITAQYELEQCIAKRRAEYPSPEEFLNAFFDGGDAALEALKAKRIEVKSKYPKP